MINIFKINNLIIIFNIYFDIIILGNILYIFYIIYTLFIFLKKIIYFQISKFLFYLFNL